MDIALLLSFTLYFVTLIGIGVAAYCWQQRQRVRVGADAANFMVGNRSLNFWITALSANASDTSSWLFMGLPVIIYSQGLAQIWVAVALIIGMLLNWQLIAPRLRAESERLNALTMASFFERRFGDTSGVLRLVTAGVIFFYFAIYVSAMLVAIGKIFAPLFELSYAMSIFVGICSVVVYTALGGFVAAAWTSCFQALFMLGSILLVPLVAYYHGYGFPEIVYAAQLRGLSLHIFGDCSGASFVNIIMIMLGWGLGYFGMPHVQAKFMGIDDVRNVRKSKYVSLVWQSLAYLAAIWVGLLGCAFFVGGLADIDLIFVELVRELFSSFSGGLILCGLFAATLSTIDSMVLVVASVITEDIYRPLYNPVASAQQLKRIFTLSIVGTCLIGAAIALMRLSSIYGLVWLAWSGLGSSFGPLMLCSLYTQWVTKRGALAGILAGAAAVALWHPLSAHYTVYSIEISSMVVGFVMSFLAIWIVSLVDRACKVI